MSLWTQDTISCLFIWKWHWIRALTASRDINIACVCVCIVAVSVQECSAQQKDEIFITDVAYCEQAAILLKQAKLPQHSVQWKRDDGFLPVTDSLNFKWKVLYWHDCVWLQYWQIILHLHLIRGNIQYHEKNMILKLYYIKGTGWRIVKYKKGLLTWHNCI